MTEMKQLVVLMLPLCLGAQEAGFQAESRLVMVPVSVMDAKGRTIEGLEAPDFELLDNGHPQRVVVDSFATGVAPIALVTAVQASGISAAALEKIQKIGAMIQPLITGERGCGALVAFSERVRWLQDCTRDPEMLARAFQSLQPGEFKSGRMLDAAQQAIDRLRRRPKVRRVLLLISESRDRGSESDLESVVMAAQTAGVTIYAMTYSAFTTAFTTRSAVRHPKQPRLPSKNPVSIKGEVPIPPADQRMDILGGFSELARLGDVNTTEVLTTVTGGAVFPFTRQKGLENAIEKLGGELHTQYLLSFAPAAPIPGYHRIEVRVKRGVSLRVRARQGYWTAQPAP
jgi:VWFA-related protein